MATTFEDPICGMQVTSDAKGGKSQYKGQSFYFCSAEHKKMFDENPEKYAKQKQKMAR